MVDHKNKIVELAKAKQPTNIIPAAGLPIQKVHNAAVYKMEADFK